MGSALTDVEGQAMDGVDKLVREGKIDEALAELDRMLRQTPGALDLLKKKYEVLWASKRFEDCLQLLNNVPPNVPPEVQREILNGKRFVLFELIKVALENKDIETALDRLDELAGTGYRGFHDLNRDEFFEPLWNLPRYKLIQKRIAENSGIGLPALDFSVELPNGQTYRLSERKEKVVLVDFWSTSCVPCKKELPNLKDLYDSYRNRGFEIVSINLDSDKKVLAKYLADNPVPWETVFSGKGFNDDVALLYDVSWVPSYWLVDGKGVLRFFDVRGEDLRAAVARLTGE